MTTPDSTHNLSTDTTYQNLLSGNRSFVNAELAKDPDYFTNLAKGQSPEVLWIGCSDSRVPANQLTNTKPGEIFVHRNIANVCSHADLNMLSVLDYAVNVLKVKHVIVAGHYMCGGVNAAMGNKQYGLIDNWLQHIKDVYRIHAAELDAIADEAERSKRFVELNVVEQVNNLSRTPIIQNALKQRNDLFLHGWVIDISSGLVKDLEVSEHTPETISQVFGYK